MTLKWKREEIKESGRTWTDWVSDDGRYRLEQGRDTYESRRGFPWLLLRVRKDGIHKRIAPFHLLEEGQDHAAAREAQREINKALASARVDSGA